MELLDIFLIDFNQLYLLGGNLRVILYAHYPPTKMSNKGVGLVDYRKKAYEMFFNEHKKIIEIAEILGKNRKTISTFLSTQDGFIEEKDRRKLGNKQIRKEYKADWEKRNRKNTGTIDAEILKRQHRIDVAVLSADRY